MEIKNNASKLIKPSTPTPSTLRNYNISFFDELQPDLDVHVILYYSASQSDSNNVNIFNHFESSLSKALTIFYPLVGRYVRDNLLIDCSDQGALYVQAKANFQLTKLLGLAWELKLSIISKLLACEIHDASEIHNRVVLLLVCVFHKNSQICQLYVCTFIDTWATINKKIDNTLELGKHSPSFIVARNYPKRGLHLSHALPRSNVGAIAKILVRAFLFKGEPIAKRRKNLKVNGSHRPSKVQIVASLLWKSFVRLDKANTGQFNVSTLSRSVNLKNLVVPTFPNNQSVNLRNIVVPKFPSNLCSNFVTLSNARFDHRERQNVDLQEFCDVFHESIKKIDSNYAKAVAPGGKEYEVLLKPFWEYYESNRDNDTNTYLLSSWCKFSWQNTDFGWGKRVWRIMVKMEAQNMVVMMDDQEGDGVEAWVHLDEKRMCQLEQDPDIKTCAYLVQ